MLMFKNLFFLAFLPCFQWLCSPVFQTMFMIDIIYSDSRRIKQSNVILSLKTYTSQSKHPIVNGAIVPGNAHSQNSLMRSRPCHLAWEWIAVDPLVCLCGENIFTPHIIIIIMIRMLSMTGLLSDAGLRGQFVLVEDQPVNMLCSIQYSGEPGFIQINRVTHTQLVKVKGCSLYLTSQTDTQVLLGFIWPAHKWPFCLFQPEYFQGENVIRVVFQLLSLLRVCCYHYAQSLEYLTVGCFVDHLEVKVLNVSLLIFTKPIRCLIPNMCGILLVCA